ncbi:MAG TPA: YezD family protein [Armatimonadota bacterium]|nr:YezD family protein [Armatimonadota bacterium]
MTGLPRPRNIELDSQQSGTNAEILAAIQTVRFGTVRIIIQDGRVVQIEKTEKVRLEPIRSRGD